MKCKAIATSATPAVSSFFISLLWSENLTKVEVCGIEVKGRLSHKRIDANTASVCFLPVLLIPMISYLSFLHVNEFGTTQFYIRLRRIKKRARDGSICIFKYQSTLQFGSIIQFCFAKRQVVAIIRIFKLMEQTILGSLRTPTLPDDSAKA